MGSALCPSMEHTPYSSTASAALQGLSRTLFERLQSMYGESISEMLTVQYRMHAGIMDWSSQELYHGKLTAHPSVAAHTLSDLQARDFFFSLGNFVQLYRGDSFNKFQV